MKIATHSTVINAPFPIKPYGFMVQTKELTDVHDDLHARIISIEDNEGVNIHISCDLIGLPASFQDTLFKRLKKQIINIKSLTVSVTHTHFGPSPYNNDYLVYLQDCLYNDVMALDYKTYEKVSVSYRYEPFEGVGKSRISNHHANVYLQLMTIYHDENPIVVFIVHNCHPTILSGDTPYFSSEYPGLTIRNLQCLYPNTFFTYIQGAAGDVSTRFTRSSQTYDAVEELACVLTSKINSMLNQTISKKKFAEVGYTKTVVPFCHDMNTIDFVIPEGLSEREVTTINQGVIMRERLLSKPELLINEVMISRLTFGPYKILFAPSEMFSYFISAIDINDTALGCYSNGYSPYITGLDLKVITYEKFTDTLTQETKERLYEALSNISRN